MGLLEATAIGRELGQELRYRRLASGLLGSELARKLEWSASKVSRLEHGQRAAAEVDVVHYLALCGAKRSDIDDVLELLRNAGRGFWMPQQLRSLVFHESTASAIVDYDPLIVPGLLQTEGYATALISSAQISQRDVDAAVHARTRRHRVLYDSLRPARGMFYIHEQVLRMPVGGDRVMNEQLLKLALLTDRPTISVRVVPLSLGADSYFGPSFRIFEYRSFPPLVYQENSLDGLFVEEAEYVRGYRQKLGRISSVALDAEQSRVLLASMASEYDRLDGDPDDSTDRVAQEQPQR